MSNLYQSSTGGTPVTADGQPVGLVLDKSRGVIKTKTDTNITWDSLPSGVSQNANVLTFTGILSNTLIQVANFYDLGDLAYCRITGTSSTSNSSFRIYAGNTFIQAQESPSGKTIESLSVATINGLAIFVFAGFEGTITIDEVYKIQGIHAQQPVSTQRPTYNANPDRLTLDLVDDSLLVTIPTGGWDGYMVLGTDEGTASYGVSLLAGDYELGGDYFPGNSINQVLFREGDVHPIRLKTVEQKFVDDGAKASYGDVTDFGSYWRDKGITEFPLIDTSNGTNFNDTWRNNNLTGFPLINTSSGISFSSAWQNNNLTSFPLIDTSSGTSFFRAWFGNNLTSFPLIDTSSGTNFFGTWQNNNLTSFPLIDTSNGTKFSTTWSGNNLTEFPLIDTSNGTDFERAWYGNNLTSFPTIDTSSGTNFSSAWRANDLTSFPVLDTSNGIDFSEAWRDNNLTSFPLIDTSSGTQFSLAWWGNDLTSFPALDFSSGTNFTYAWIFNNNLTDFPANMFDNCNATIFTDAFSSTNLSQSSIDGILVSIESNGTSNGTFDQSGGSAPSATGEAAIDRLYTRGWDITVTGGYQGKFLPELLFENNENGFWYSPEIGE